MRVGDSTILATARAGHQTRACGGMTRRVLPQLSSRVGNSRMRAVLLDYTRRMAPAR